MHRRRSFLSLLTLGLLAFVFLAACSGGKLGYGVVLWAGNNSAVKTGQIVTVKSQSKINNTYAVEVSGSNSTVDMPTWRIKLFSAEQNAINFSLSYSSMVPMFAKATVNGALIRQQPASGATQIYRMRDGQVVKVIARGSQKVTVNGVDGYWYQILTNDGVLGYTFNANLEVYNPQVEGPPQVSAGQQLLEKVLQTTYRPDYFQQMIQNNQIDLKKFSTKYGFYADPQTKTLRIVMPTYDLTFTYTGITKRATGDYMFNGTPVELLIKSPEEIQLLYTDSKGNQHDKVFLQIKQDISYLVEKEKNRRLKIYNGFLNNSPYTSSYYGKITLGANMGFTWSGYNRLVPNIIPPGAGPTGVVAFPLFLGPGLQGSYDGAISFVFGASSSPSGLLGQSSGGNGTDLAAISPGVPGGSQAGNSSGGAQTPSLTSPSTQGTSSGGTQTVSFLYNNTPNGIKLTYVPQNAINGDIVTGTSSTPIVIVFQAKGSGG